MIIFGNMQGDLLKTKQHFEILDGLRGVAAIVVVIFHFMEIVYDPAHNFVGHGFMAVDFFFCLSGFVIAYAYDSRMERIGFKSFFISRIIRLHPLVVLGSVMGLIAFLLDPFMKVPGGYNIGLLFLTSILMIPYPVVAERYFNLFNLNAPSWSLFWEYVANVLYGMILWRLNKKVLAAMMVLAAMVLGYVSYTAGNLLGGWSGETFWHGGARIAYSFLAGMVVYRFNWIIRNRLGFAGMALLLVAALVMPHTAYNWVTEWVVVVFYFPLLVSLGAGAGMHVATEKMCNFLGQISYPLYMTHYMVMFIFANYYAQYKPGTGQLVGIVVIGLLLLIGFAYLVMRLYDIPVRKYLTKLRNNS